MYNIYLSSTLILLFILLNRLYIFFKSYKEFKEYKINKRILSQLKNNFNYEFYFYLINIMISRILERYYLIFFAMAFLTTLCNVFGTYLNLTIYQNVSIMNIYIDTFSDKFDATSKAFLSSISVTIL